MLSVTPEPELLLPPELPQAVAASTSADAAAVVPNSLLSERN
jgi:hypothetical protein